MISVVIAIILLTIITDILLYFEGGIPSTISYAMASFGKKYPIVPYVGFFVAGLLLGHFWWGLCP